MSIVIVRYSCRFIHSRKEGHKNDQLPDTSATRHFGIKALWDTSAPISRHFDTKNVVRDTSTRVPWSRKSRDTSTQDNSDDTQLHRGDSAKTSAPILCCRSVSVLKCLVAEVSSSLYVHTFLYIIYTCKSYNSVSTLFWTWSWCNIKFMFYKDRKGNIEEISKH